MKKPIVILAATAFMLTACSTTNPYTGESQLSRTSIGAGAGALLGAATGALVSKNDRKGALIGAGVGALAGAGIGNYMDNQEAQLRQRLEATGVSVTRQGDNIILNMPGNITFASESAAINGNFTDVLQSVALVLNEYKQTLIDVNGHTDNTGTRALNQQLSQQRAQAVADYLVSLQVNPQRMAVQGFADTQPIATNNTEAGKAQNRRVEIRLVPLT
jgi:outer membrane protein OmpA-like peptidoglycan-associated protein